MYKACQNHQRIVSTEILARILLNKMPTKEHVKLETYLQDFICQVLDGNDSSDLGTHGNDDVSNEINSVKQRMLKSWILRVTRKHYVQLKILWLLLPKEL